MSEEAAFEDVFSLAVGAVGDPGQRVFMLQASTHEGLFTVIVEKQDALALGRASYELLVGLGETELASRFVSEASSFPSTDLAADEPRWRAGSLGLGFDEEARKAVIVCSQLVDLGEDPDTVRFHLTLEQLTIAGIQAMAVSAKGRPICPICGLVMESDAHVCPSTNGHKVISVG